MQRHAVDYLSIVFGTLFVVVALFFGLRGWDPFTIDARWIAPVILLALGLAFLAPSHRQRKAEPLRLGDAAELESDSALEDARDELPPSPLD